MRFPLEVSYTDGKTDKCIAEYPDLVAFEEKFDRSVLRLNSELRLRDLGFLAWSALTREKRTSAPLEEWTLTVSMVRATDEDTDIVPLEQ